MLFHVGALARLNECETTPNIDPTDSKLIKHLGHRSASRPHADSHVNYLFLAMRSKSMAD
jgi:hypothetical protein